jgi:hypothetical protein
MNRFHKSYECLKSVPDGLFLLVAWLLVLVWPGLVIEVED